MVQTDISCRVYLTYYISLPVIICRVSKEYRGRYDEGSIDTELTVIVACVL